MKNYSSGLKLKRSGLICIKNQQNPTGKPREGGRGGRGILNGGGYKNNKRKYEEVKKQRRKLKMMQTKLK